MADSKIKYFKKFSDKIIAVSYRDGAALHYFLRKKRLDKSIFDSYEILDFQRYRIIHKRAKVADFIHAELNEQIFKFLVNKN